LWKKQVFLPKTFVSLKNVANFAKENTFALLVGLYRVIARAS
jgi:hypothetical protein